MFPPIDVKRLQAVTPTGGNTYRCTYFHTVGLFFAINTIGKINYTRPNAFLTRVFFDAKSDEIVSIFSAGPSMDIRDLIGSLNTISPLNSSKWAGIKY